MRFNPLFTVGTLLLEILIMLLINITICVSEDIAALKSFLPVANILVILIGAFSVISIKQIEETTKTVVERSLLKEHLAQVKSLVKTLQGERHEHTRHIQTIQAMLYLGETNAAKEYVEGVTEDYWHTHDLPYVGNPALSALLHAKTLVCETKGITFDFAIKCNVNELRIQPWDLSSILGNLLDNAIEATLDDPGNRTVGLEIKEEQEDYKIYVFNTGAGFPNKEKVFEPGFTTKGSEARGYGLFLVRKKTTEQSRDVLTIYSGAIRRYFLWRVFCLLPTSDYPINYIPASNDVLNLFCANGWDNVSAKLHFLYGCSNQLKCCVCRAR